MSSVDPVQTYLAQVGQLGRMSAEEERVIIDRIHRAEQRLRELLATTGLAARHYLDLAAAIADGHERLDRWVMERHLQNREEFIRELPAMVEELRRRIAVCDERKAACVRSINGSITHARAAFDESLASVQAMLPVFCFKTRAHSHCLTALRPWLERLDSIDAGGYDESLEFAVQAWMKPTEFRRIVSAALQADAAAATAKQSLIEGHLWLVIVIARSYPCQGMGLLDLIQEGNLGLMRAADMYEGHRECRFNSYASWWIRQAITRGMMDQARLIRLPAYLTASISSILRVQRQLGAAMGREPTEEDLAEELQMNPERVRLMLGALQPPVSLQSKVSNDPDASELAELIEDTRITAPDESRELNQLGDRLHDVLNPLTEQERWVVTERFGLEGHDSRSMEELAKQVNLSKQRIHQIESKAMKKLRHPKRLQMLNRLLGRAQS